MRWGGEGKTVAGTEKRAGKDGLYKMGLRMGEVREILLILKTKPHIGEGKKDGELSLRDGKVDV